MGDIFNSLVVVSAISFNLKLIVGCLAFLSAVVLKKKLMKNRIANLL